MSRSSAITLYAVVALFFACFLVWPIFSTVEGAFSSSAGGFKLDYIGEIFRNAIYLQGLLNSLVIAAGTTLGCVALALPLAILFTRFAFPGKMLLNGLLLTPLVLPPFVGAIGIKTIFGQAGALNSLLFSLGLADPERPPDWFGGNQLAGVVLMQVLHLYPILYMNLVAAFAALDPATEEAAATLGSSPFHRFGRITLPLIMPGFFAGGSLIFIWAFTELGVPLVFDYDRVTAVQIFRSLNDLGGNPFPYALVTVLLVISAGIYGCGRWLFGSSILASASTPTVRAARPLPPLAGLACAAFFGLVLIVAILPHLAVVLLSFAQDWYATPLPAAFTLDHYQAALSHPLTLASIANSIKYSALALILAFLLGLAVAFLNVRSRLPGRQLLDLLAMLPLAVPGVVLAFGFLAMTRPGQPFDWLVIGGDPLLLMGIAYAVRRLPYIVRSATAGLQQIHPSLEEAALTLGATHERAVQRVVLPLVTPHLAAGAVLAFAFAMLEVSDSMVLAQQAVHFPITKAIYSLLLDLGNGPNLAAALGTWAMLFLTATLIAAAALLGRRLSSLFR